MLVCDTVVAGGVLGYRDAASKRLKTADDQKKYLKSLETDPKFIELEAKLIAEGRWKRKPKLDDLKDRKDIDDPKN